MATVNLAHVVATVESVEPASAEQTGDETIPANDEVDPDPTGDLVETAAGETALPTRCRRSSEATAFVVTMDAAVVLKYGGGNNLESARRMEHEPKVLQSVMQRAAPPDLALTFRAMFGGIMAYADGKPVASLSNVGLALKLSGADRTEMLALVGAAPLQYGPDLAVSKAYVVVPAAVMSNTPTLRTWIVRSVANLPLSGTKRRRKK